LTHSVSAITEDDMTDVTYVEEGCLEEIDAEEGRSPSPKNNLNSLKIYKNTNLVLMQ
jgi:hypothetical protein